MKLSFNDKVEGVPMRSNPVYWDRTLRVEDNLVQVDAWIGHYSHYLPQGAVIDEAAIMVPDPWHRRKVTEQLEQADWAKFNEASDMVYTTPFGTRYCVSYEFYHSNDRPYRLEVMMMDRDWDGYLGNSPLHDALQSSADRNQAPKTPIKYPIPHLSFKAPRVFPVSNERHAYAKAVDYIKSKACIHAQSCQSTYGTFSYFIGNETMRQIYLKPRVNLRDAE